MECPFSLAGRVGLLSSPTAVAPEAPPRTSVPADPQLDSMPEEDVYLQPRAVIDVTEDAAAEDTYEQPDQGSRLHQFDVPPPY